jgi:ATP-binding cassette subfamily B protein
VSTSIDATSSLGTVATLRRGLDLSPELRRGLWVTLGLAAITTVGRIVVPFVVQQTTDHGLLGKGGPDPGLVTTYVLFALIAVAATALSAYAVNVRLFRASEAGLASLRLKAFRHIHDLSMLTQNTERRGSMVSRVTSDVDTISQFVQFGGIILVLSLGQIAVATALMFYYSPLLTGVVWLCFVPLLFVIKRFQAIVGRAYTIVRERVGDLLAAVSESVVGAATIRAYGVEERTAHRIDGAIEAHRSASIRAQVRSVVAFSSGQLVAGLTLAVVLVVGTIQAAAGHLTLGQLLAFLFLVNLFTQPVQQATEILNELQNAVAGWRRVIGVIDTPADVADPGDDGQVLPRGPIAAPTPCCTTSASPSVRAVASRSWGRPARASRPSPSCSPG